MPINETVYLHRNHRVCVGKNGNQKIWNKYSFWTHSSDVWFEDGTTLESKMSSLKGITNNINSGAGYAADVSLVKSIRDSLKGLIDNLTNVVNGINNRLGGLRFYEDSNGKWVVGADSVPKKLGSGLEDIENILSDTFVGNRQTWTASTDGTYIMVSGRTLAGSDGSYTEHENSEDEYTGCWTDITTDGKIITEENTMVGEHNENRHEWHPEDVTWFILVQLDAGQSVFVKNHTWGYNSSNNGNTTGNYIIMSP